MLINILYLILNLTAQKNIILKKKKLNFQYIRSRIKYNNIRLYGNFIYFKNTKPIKQNISNTLIPLIYQINANNFSNKKYNQIIINKKPIKYLTLKFIKNIKVYIA